MVDACHSGTMIRGNERTRDVKPETVEALARKYYGDWKKGYRPVDIAAEPPQREPKSGRIDWPNPIHPFLFAGYHIPAFSDRTVDSAALDVIAQLLFAESAPLYQELVVDKQWVDFLQGSADSHRDRPGEPLPEPGERERHNEPAPGWHCCELACAELEQTNV